MGFRYLLDEHVHPDYRRELLRREPGLEVWLIGDPGAPTRGTPDPEILQWCERAGFILVTSNRKSMPRHLTDHLAQGGHVPGILTLNPDMGMGEVIEQLLLIAGAAHADEYQDQIVYLPVT